MTLPVSTSRQHKGTIVLVEPTRLEEADCGPLEMRTLATFKYGEVPILIANGGDELIKLQPVIEVTEVYVHNAE